MKFVINPFSFAIYFFIFSLNFETLNIGIDFLATKITLSILLLVSLFNISNIFSSKKYLKFIIPIVSYFTLLTIVSYINRNTLSSTYFDYLLFLNIIIFIILINQSKIDPTILHKGLFIFSISTALLTFLFFLGIGVSVSEEGRYTIFEMNQNYLGLHLTISLLVLISVIFENRLQFNNRRFLLLLLFPFLLMFMIKTGSRVALLSFFLGVLYFVFYNRSIQSSKKIMLMFGVFLIFGLLWFVLLKDSIVLERLNETVNKGDLANRDLIWVTLFSIFSNNFLYGVGKTGYFAVAGEASPHNVLIEVLCYTGLIGLIIFMTFLIIIWHNAYRKNKYGKELLPMLLFIPVLGTIFTGQIFDHKIFWVLFAFIAGITKTEYAQPLKSDFHVLK